MKSFLLLFALPGFLLAAPGSPTPALEKFSPAEIRSGTDGGAAVTAWFAGDRPQKIVLWLGLSSREVKETFTYTADGQLVSVAIFKRDFALDDATGKLDPTRTESTTESSHRFDRKPLPDESEDERAASQTLGAKLYRQLLGRPRSVDLTSLTADVTAPRKEK